MQSGLTSEFWYFASQKKVVAVKVGESSKVKMKNINGAGSGIK